MTKSYGQVFTVFGDGAVGISCCGLCNIRNIYLSIVNMYFCKNSSSLQIIQGTGQCLRKEMIVILKKQAKKNNTRNQVKSVFTLFPTMNHLIQKRSITESLLLYLICPLAHDSATPCSFTIQQRLQVSWHENSQQIYFGGRNHRKRKIFKKEREKSDERAQSDNAAGISWCIESSRPPFFYVREQAAATLSGKIFSVYLHEEQREGYRFMVITVQKGCG